MVQNNSQAKYFTRGGQIIFHNLRMLFQINKVVGKIYFVSLCILTAAITYLITPRAVITAAYYWCYAQLAPLLSLLGFKSHTFTLIYHGVLYIETPKSFLAQWQFVEQAHSLLHYLLGGFVIAFALSMILAYFVVRWLTNKGKEQTENKFIRGAQLDSSKNVAKKIKKNEVASDITIDGFPMIVDTETQHSLFHGTTGSGKTQLAMKRLDCMRKRGSKVFIYDKGCVYTSVYYRDGKDKILNPFDERCENWDLWSEALDAPDFENMAESLIPMYGEADPFWVDAARTIFASAAYTMQDDKDRSIRKLLKLLLTSELQDLSKYLAETAAATLTSNKIEKTAISIRSIITTYLKSLRFLQGLDKPSKATFSIRDWIQNSDDDSWLFISSKEDQHAALKPLISMWFAMGSSTLLSLPENRDRRIHIECDELASLHRLPLLSETLAEARKFGGCFGIGLQSYAQLVKVYGKSAAEEIFDLLNTRFFFRSPSAAMAKLVSHELGDQEIEDMRENYSYGANRIRDGISIGSQRVTRPIVAYPEIMELADMSCYVRLPGNYPVTKLNLKFEKRTKIEAGFIKRNIQTDKELEETIRKIEQEPAIKVVARKINNNSTNISTSVGANEHRSINANNDTKVVAKSLNNKQEEKSKEPI